MYKAKYELKTSKTSERKTKVNCSFLTAKFFFGKEVAPNKRSDIEGRYRRIESLLYKYLTEIEKLKVGARGYFDDFRNLETSAHDFRLGFTIIAHCSDERPLEKIIDLDAINELILTGKICENKQE